MQRPWIGDAQKIDVGPSNGFVFYIYNLNKDLFVRVLLPKTAKLKELGESQQKEVSLTVPELGSEFPLLFGPRFHMNEVGNAPQ